MIQKTKQLIEDKQIASVSIEGILTHRYDYIPVSESKSISLLHYSWISNTLSVEVQLLELYCLSHTLKTRESRMIREKIGGTREF